MDMNDDSEDYGPTVAKRMRVSVAEVSVEEVKAEVAIETEQHARVTITLGNDDQTGETPPDDGSLKEDESNPSEGHNMKKKKKGKKENAVILSASVVSEGILSCQVPGCDQRFASVVDHDIHYNARHRHVCNTCRKPLANPHLLELHVLEHHDAFFAILAERKPMYSCLEETCSQKFTNSEERLEHCVSEHQFSKTYRLGGKPKAFKQDSKEANKLDQTHRNKSSNGSQEATASGSSCNEVVLVNKKKPKSNINIKDENSTATHITFGRHGVRFIPRQVFAMPKKSKPRKISAPNNSTEEMTDLSDLQDALQVASPRIINNAAASQDSAVDIGGANTTVAVEQGEGMEA